MHFGDSPSLGVVDALADDDFSVSCFIRAIHVLCSLPAAGGQPLAVHNGSVKAETIGELEGREVVVSGNGGAVGVWDPAAYGGKELTEHYGSTPS